MNYDEINADEVLAEVDAAIEQGDYRQATKQETVEEDHQLIKAMQR